jgi:hypothetical protein
MWGGGEWWVVGRGKNSGGGFRSVGGVFPEGFKGRVGLRNKRDDEWVRMGRVGDLCWRVVPLRFFSSEGCLLTPAPLPSRVEGDHEKQVRSSTFMFALQTI